MIGLVGIAVALLALAGASAAMAAPGDQDQPTATPSPTRTPGYVGPTFTPTTTLMPPPEGGGRVAVAELVVRYGPSQDYDALGGLPWNAEVYPIARSENGLWVAIEWTDKQIGWISALLVVWDPDLDLAGLPVLLPPATFTPRPDTDTPAPTEPTLTATATATAQISPTAPPGDTQPALSPTPEPTQTPAEVAAAIPTAGGEVESGGAAPDLPERPAATLPTIDPRVGLYVGGGLLVALVGVYGWQRLAAGRELRRYVKGFPLEGCPVCQEGQLELDEVVRHVFGIPRVQRSVRCNVCRSVLRGLGPGQWRYTIDPYVNPALAEKYNGVELADADLPGFARQALDYPPQAVSVAPQADPEQTAQELISKLEAKFLRERAKMEAEEKARAAAEEKARLKAERAARRQAKDGGGQASEETPAESGDGDE